MVYIERMGTDEDDFWRRIAGVYEIDRVTDGVPHTRLLHRWNRESDQFERLDNPQLLFMDGSVLTQRAQRLQRLVDAGRTSQADVETLRIP